MVMQQDELVMNRQATAAEPQTAGGQEQPPAALLARAEQMQAATNDVLQGRLDRWADLAVPVHSEAASTAPVSEAGTPITDYGYAYWDCLMYGPYQFPGPSALPVRPNKIIRANEWALLSALVWINPAFHFGNLPDTDRRRPQLPRQVRAVQLLGRDQRSRSGHRGRVPRPGTAVHVVRLLVPLSGPGSGP